MRIVFLTELSHAGGVDTFLLNLVGNWPRQEDELVVLTNPGCPGLKMLQEKLAGRARVESHGITVYGDIAIRMGLGTFGRMVSSLLLRPAMMVHCFAHLRILFASLDPDRVMLVAGGFPGGDTIRLAVLAWAGVRGNRPLALLNLHNLVAPAKAWQIATRSFDRWIARRCSAIVSVSRASAASVSERPGLVEAIGTSYIYNGLDKPVRGDGVGVRATFDVPPHALVVAMLSTYEERKGHSFLLHAFRKVVEGGLDAVLVICGHGSREEIERVRTLSADLGLERRVVLSGFRADARRLLEVAAVVAVPSQTFESFSYVAVEALAFGVPVVATRCGGLSEVVADGEGGWCVPNTDIDGFADRLHRLLSDSALRKDQGDAGRLRFERLFTADRMAREYAALII